MTNITLAARTGTEVVTAEVALALVARGHTVAVYTTVLGPLVASLRSAGVIVADRIGALAAFEPDLIHAHHSSTYAIVQSAFPATPSVWFCHDVLSWHDEPPNVPQIVLYVCYGATTFNRVVYEGGVEPQRVRYLPNAADVPVSHRFDPPQSIRTALIVAKYQDSHVGIIERACTAMGIEARVVGGGRGAVSDTMAAEYACCDLVFGSGKVAIEAIASGRPVVCVDERGAAGLVTSDLFSNWRARNFGGSILRHPVDEAFIANEIRLFDPLDFIHLLTNYRAELLLDTYMDRLEAIYAEALEIESSRTERVASVALASYLERVLPLGRGPGTVVSPSDLIAAQSNSARFRAEAEQLRLEAFTFAKERPLTFTEGEAGRATLREGWRRDDPSSIWSDAAHTRLVIPSGTGWQNAAIVKIEGLVFAPAFKPFESLRRLTFVANGIRKIEVTHTNDPSKEEAFVYYWFEIDDALIAQADDGALELVLEVDPYVPEICLGRGFRLYKLWAI